MIKECLKTLESYYAQFDENADKICIARAMEAYAIATELTKDETTLAQAFLYDFYLNTHYSDAFCKELFEDWNLDEHIDKNYLRREAFSYKMDVLVANALADLRYMEGHRRIIYYHKNEDAYNEISLFERQNSNHQFYIDLLEVLVNYRRDWQDTAAFNEYKCKVEKQYLLGTMDFSFDEELKKLQLLLSAHEKDIPYTLIESKFRKIQRMKDTQIIDYNNLVKSVHFNEGYQDVWISPITFVKYEDNKLIIPIAVANTDPCDDVVTKYEDVDYSPRDQKVESLYKLFSCDSNDMKSRVYWENENLSYGREELVISCDQKQEAILYAMDLSYHIENEKNEVIVWIFIGKRVLRKLLAR